MSRNATDFDRPASVSDPAPPARIGIMADSHGEADSIEAAATFFHRCGCALSVHLGDICDTTRAETALACLERLTAHHILAIRGNNDHTLLLNRSAQISPKALAIIREFVEEGWYAGGGKTGTHWHFVDAAGKRLEISCSSTEMTHVYHSGKVYFSAREDSRAAADLREAASPMDFATFRNVSRDPSVCFPSSIAGMTAEISREHPALLSYAWVSMPAGGLGFPLYVGGTKTPLPLLNGEADALFRKLINPAKRWEDLEALHFADQRKLERDVEKRTPLDPPSELSRELDEWTQRRAAENMAVG